MDTNGSFLWVFPLALSLDLLSGDPRWLPHPIRWMGSAIEKLEPRFRALHLPVSLSGGLMSLGLIFCTWLLCRSLLFWTDQVWPLLSWVLAVIMVFYTLSIRSLADAAGEVYKALREEDIDTAKKKLALVVGREVDQLDGEGIARAAVETVAENLVDGIISPLFYALLGGPALAMAYKMINTLDSMIGYKNSRYIMFGRWAAKIDDIANFLPSRISVPIIALAAHLLARRGGFVFTVVKEDGRHHHSPNAGFPEAAFAGALGVKLGGPNIYHGQRIDKPYIGKKLKPCSLEQIKKACDLMLLASLLWFLLCWMVQFCLYSYS
jgi:adenosylcobinamide-phosphate synthase